jgi:hypothetical protein
MLSKFTLYKLLKLYIVLVGIFCIKTFGYANYFLGNMSKKFKIFIYLIIHNKLN